MSRAEPEKILRRKTEEETYKLTEVDRKEEQLKKENSEKDYNLLYKICLSNYDSSATNPSP